MHLEDHAPAGPVSWLIESPTGHGHLGRLHLGDNSDPAVSAAELALEVAANLTADAEQSTR